LLLDEWSAVHREIAMSIPLDDLNELYLCLTYEVEDLCGRLGSADALGAIWFNENIIRVDSSLDPSAHLQMHWRFNFTLAREISYCVCTVNIFRTIPRLQRCLIPAALELFCKRPVSQYSVFAQWIRLQAIELLVREIEPRFF